MLVSFQWIGPIAAVAVSMIMFALGLILEREQITAALHRRVGLGRRYAFDIFTFWIAEISLKKAAVS